MLKRPRRSPRGIVLILISSVLVLLMLGALLILQTVSVSSRSARRAVGAAGERLALTSGMEHAGARLACEQYPAYADTIASRADDWRVRDPAGTPLERIRNPSYSRGDPWIDGAPPLPDKRDDDRDGLADEPDEGAGLFSVGSDAPADLDGDGVHSAWSGRIRGAGAGGAPLRFLLAIEPADGKIPLNAGYLGSQSKNAFMTPHLALVHALNNLGAILHEQDPGRFSFRCEEVAVPPDGEAVRLSWLGTDLISRRPAAGFRTLDDVWTAMQAAGYSRTELEAVSPFLAVGDPEPIPEYSREESRDPVAYAPVCLAGASREVLASLWMYLGGDRGFFPGSATDLARRSTRTANNLNRVPFSSMRLLLFPDEAGALVDLAAARRRAGAYGWRDLYEAISLAGDALFPRDRTDLTDGSAWRSWAGAKADIAFMAVCMDPYPYFNTAPHPCRTWATWSVDRNGPAFGTQTWNWVSFESLRRVYTPSSFGGSYTANQPYVTAGWALRPLGLSMSPPCRYDVACLALAGTAPRGSAAGTIRVQERLDFTSQEDFENLTGGTRLYSQRGVRTVDPPSIAWRRQAAGGKDPKVVALPRWNTRSFRTAPLPAGAPSWHSYSRCYGALGLGPKYEGLSVAGADADVACPFVEDYDGNPATDCPSDGAPMSYLTVTSSTISSNPYVAYGGMPAGVGMWDCPGIRAADGTSIQALSLEAWMTSGGSFSLLGMTEVGGFDPDSGLGWVLENAPGRTIELKATPILNSSQQRAVRFDLYVEWIHTMPPIPSDPIDWKDPHITTGAAWTVREPDSPRPAGAYHVVLTIERIGAGIPGNPYRTRFRLYVNGSPFDVDGAWMEHIHQGLSEHDTENGNGVHGELGVTEEEYLAFSGADDYKLYNEVLDAVRIDGLRDRGRYVSAGTFTSPLYAFERPARLRRVSWNGFSPPAWGTGVSASLSSYQDPTGAVPEPAATGPLSAAGIVDAFDAAGAVRSFRYAVSLSAAGCSGRIDETPIFESIWLTYQQKGRSPAWREYRFR